MIIWEDNLSQSKEIIGAKAARLAELRAWGFRVPRFVVVPFTELTRLIDASGVINDIEIEHILKEVLAALPARRFAVRSSALIEDGQSASFAGQFLTFIDVQTTGLAAALRQVAEQASQYLDGHVERFAIMVQEYIEADWAGITFTRDPFGGRELVMEWHAGRGEEVASGRVTPNRWSQLWTEPCVSKKLPGLSQAVELFKKIESHYNFPQDIEWCVRDGIWYFLQTRPVTSLSIDDHQQALYLDNYLPRGHKFLFEKTEITEIAPRPVPLTFDLLLLIYAEGGPISRVYKKYNISYTATDFLKIIGNELYVDREAEIKTLFPAYSFLRDQTLSPHLSWWQGGYGTTLKNLRAIRDVSLEQYSSSLDFVDRRFALYDILKTRIERYSERVREPGVSDFLREFLEEYRAVFEASFMANLSLERAQEALRGEKGINLATLLSSVGDILEPSYYQIYCPEEGVSGNSLDVADETPFIRNAPIDNGRSPEVVAWWRSLPTKRRRYLENVIRAASVFSRLRELGRWLAVKKISIFRSTLFELARTNGFQDKRNIYFARLYEAERGSVLERECVVRRSHYEHYARFALPKTLTNVMTVAARRAVTGVSVGVARGFLVDEKKMSETSSQGKPLILFTKVLTPNLARYFHQIQGIVSETGGLLSHLAILARESGRPAIVNFFLHDLGLQLGDQIEIDGSTGRVTKLE